MKPKLKKKDDIDCIPIFWSKRAVKVICKL